MSKESDLKCKAAAWLTSAGWSRNDIADLLNAGKSARHNWIDRAREKEYLRQELNLTPGELTEASHLIYRSLADRCSEFGLLSLHVVFTREGMEGKSERRVEPSVEFGDRAAEYFIGLLSTQLEASSHRTIRVANCWGRTLLSLVRSVESLVESKVEGVPPRIANDLAGVIDHRDQLEFLPAWGEPVGFYPDNFDGKSEDEGRFRERAQLSSSILAATLNRTIGKGVSGHKALRCIPGILPVSELDENEEDLATLRELYVKFKSYNHVFGSNEPFIEPGHRSRDEGLIDHVHGILAAVGPNDDFSQQRARFRTSEHFMAYPNPEKIELAVSKAAWGDLGGLALPRPGQEKNDVLVKIEQDWMGIRERHFKQCVEAASAKNDADFRIGVVAFAEGGIRAKVIAAALHRGLISRLVIDHVCAEELMKELSGDTQFV